MIEAIAIAMTSDITINKGEMHETIIIETAKETDNPATVEENDNTVMACILETIKMVCSPVTTVEMLDSHIKAVANTKAHLMIENIMVKIRQLMKSGTTTVKVMKDKLGHSKMNVHTRLGI